MSTKLDLGKIFFLILFLTLSVMTVMAGTIKGSITDKQTREPLTGATVQIVGTTQGAIADMDGNYSLNVTNGIYTLSIKYIGYKDIVVNNVKSGKADVVLNFELESDAQTLGEVSVVARKNLEGERALQMERRKATLAIENIGSKEMSIKGISNVEEGVKNDYRYLHCRCRPAHCTGIGRPIQHDYPERPPHRLSQSRQQADSAGSISVEHHTEHHRK